MILTGIVLTSILSLNTFAAEGNVALAVITHADSPAKLVFNPIVVCHSPTNKVFKDLYASEKHTAIRLSDDFDSGSNSYLIFPDYSEDFFTENMFKVYRDSSGEMHVKISLIGENREETMESEVTLSMSLAAESTGIATVSAHFSNGRIERETLACKSVVTSQDLNQK